MALSKLSTLNACSLRYMNGLNYGPGVGIDVDTWLARGAGTTFYHLYKAGWSSGSPEIVAGYECNSDNPNQHAGHIYRFHCGHVLKRIVGHVGGVGKIHLSPWSYGVGGSGSQTRFVLWYFPSAKDSAARIAELMALDNPDEIVASFVAGIRAGRSEGAW